MSLDLDVDKFKMKFISVPDKYYVVSSCTNDQVNMQI